MLLGTFQHPQKENPEAGPRPAARSFTDTSLLIDNDALAACGLFKYYEGKDAYHEPSSLATKSKKLSAKADSSKPTAEYSSKSATKLMSVLKPQPRIKTRKPSEFSNTAMDIDYDKSIWEVPDDSNDEDSNLSGSARAPSRRNKGPPVTSMNRRVANTDAGSSSSAFELPGQRARPAGMSRRFPAASQHLSPRVSSENVVQDEDGRNPEIPDSQSENIICYDSDGNPLEGDTIVVEVPADYPRRSIARRFGSTSNGKERLL
ncbi:hypothetical protein BDZ45DRAFT_735940 [Acephala macrosclerotiorum]|nr:hypothetical protein BDZ45DRAFT_735940 [Acephala macrosclerotiorum]